MKCFWERTLILVSAALMAAILHLAATTMAAGREVPELQLQDLIRLKPEMWAGDAYEEDCLQNYMFPGRRTLYNLRSAAPWARPEKDGKEAYETVQGHYSIEETPYGKDIVRDYLEGLRKHGLATGLYFPIPIGWITTRGSRWEICSAIAGLLAGHQGTVELAAR